MTQPITDILSTSLPATYSDKALVSNTNVYSTDEKEPRGFLDKPLNGALLSTVGAVSALGIAGLVGCICATNFKAAGGLTTRYIIATTYIVVALK